MYERFYGLTRIPFAVTPDPAMLFMSRVHREALATIIYGVETRKGFIVCTGEVGTGKSTIIRAFFDQTLADTVKLIYIFTPQVSPLEMAQYICREMGMEHPESIFAAVPQLQLKLLEVFESGKTVVLMIDEAQLLPPETLEFLRLLSNFETDTEKLIQIVLVGQPEVDTMLARRDMRQVNQRVALRARLAGLSVEESFEYIEHRLRISGANELAQVMSPSAAWLIAEAAGGIPRVINILADNVLIAGFGAGQRPLGSQLAGTTISEFVAKSGPARPPAAQRFGAGWAAARRLRGALAREKGEAEEWAFAMPNAARAAPALAPLASAETQAAAPPSRIAAPDGSPQNLAPMPRPAPITRPPTVAPVPVPPAPPPTPAATPAAPPAPPPPAVAVETVAAAELIEPTTPALPRPPARPAAAGDAAAVAMLIEPTTPPPPRPPAPPTAAVEKTGVVLWIEPTADWRTAEIAAGSSVSSLGLVMVAPVAEAELPATQMEPLIVRRPAFDPLRRPFRPPPPRALPRVNGAAIEPPEAAIPRAAPRLVDPAVQWPALSRVRTGLQTAPRRAPDER